MSENLDHPVHFEPAQRLVRVRRGESLLAAAQRSGIHIDSSCGGAGSCLQCRVSVISHSPRVAESSEKNLKGAGGLPLNPLADPRTPSGEEQGRHRCYLACSVEATGPLHVRVEPRGGIGARNHRPSIVGQCAIPGSWNASSYRGPGQIDIYIPCAATESAVPALTARTSDFTILDSRIEAREDFTRKVGGVDVAKAPIVICGDGLAPISISRESLVGIEASLAGPSNDALVAAQAIMLHGCYFDQRRAGTVIVGVGVDTHITYRAPSDQRDKRMIRTKVVPSTPMLAGLSDASNPSMMPRRAGAIECIEFSPMTPRAILSSVGDAEPIGLSVSGLWEFVGEALRVGILKPDGTFNASRALREGREGREYVLTSPEIAAMTLTGRVWNASKAVAISEQCTKAFLSELSRVSAGVCELIANHGVAPDEISLVIAGGYGFYPSRNALDALPIGAEIARTISPFGQGHDQATIENPVRIESVGDSLSLGAALLAFESLSRTIIKAT